MTVPDDRLAATVRGSLRAIDGKAVIRMEDRFDTDIDDLWSALTDPPRLARWIAQVDGDLRPGRQFQARFTSGGEGPARLDVCQPPRRLQVTMLPGQDEQSVIEAELSTEGERTRLVIEQRGLPLGEVAAFGAGWQVHLEHLAAYLASRPATDFLTRAAELRLTYHDQQHHLLTDRGDTHDQP